MAKLINNKLLSSLVCPITRSSLKYDKKKDELISEAAAMAFPVRNGIPILIVDEARNLEYSTDSSDWNAWYL